MLSVLPPPVPQASPAGTVVTTYAADCATPREKFKPGDTVCAKIEGVDLVSNSRIDWINSNGEVKLRGPDITSDPQFASFTLSNPANLGGWRVSVTSNADSSGRGSAPFLVGDPNSATANLAITKFAALPTASADADSTFLLTITNHGPDDASNVKLTDAVPAGTTFVGATQTSGTLFNCNNPSAGGTGTTTCTVNTLAQGETASFLLVYKVNSGAQAGDVISNTVNLTSDTTELRPADNIASDSVDVRVAQCFINAPSNIVMGTDANEYGAIVTYPDPTFTGNCGTVTSTPASGSLFPVGTTIVTVGGDTDAPVSFTVTINDTQDPVISCTADITVFENPTGSGSAIVNYAPPSAVDNDPGVQVSCDKASGSSFELGTNTVTCTATDGANRSATCTFDIIVQSTASDCEMVCPEDIVVDSEPGSCGAVVNYPNATTTGSCSDLTYSKASGSVFPAGTTVVKVTAESGHSCSFKVTVKDNEAPVISCPAPIIVNAPASACEAPITVTPPAATDNCSGGVTVTGQRSDNNPLNFAFPAGTTTITWTAKDAAGNTSSCEQLVTVKDAINPTITAPPPPQPVLADVNNQAEVPDLSEGLVSSDNCTPLNSLTITQSPAAGTQVGPGIHTITFTVVDSSGNTASATTTFTVLYRFTGFFSPVGNPPVLNSVNAGRAIPVKFSLNGNLGLNIFATGSPSSGIIPCDLSAPPSEVTETLTAGDSNLSYDPTSNQYIYVWKTQGSWAGSCRQLIVTLNDGTVHTVNFKFK